MQLTLEAATLLSLCCVCHLHGAAARSARAEHPPDHRVEDAPHGTRFSFVMLPGACFVVHARLSAGLIRLWHIAALRPVVFDHSEVPVVATHSSIFVISDIMSVSGFQLVRL